ncbi:MAG: twin-arginine translocase TatA/TatE family subunit [Gemmataceae bacterium]
MFGLGLIEVAVILVLALFLFGSKLPDVMRWLGVSFAEFKREANGLTEELRGR